MIDCYYKDDECNYECLHELQLKDSVKYQSHLSKCFSRNVTYECEALNGTIITEDKENFMCNGNAFCKGDFDELEEHCPWRFFCREPENILIKSNIDEFIFNKTRNNRKVQENIKNLSPKRRCNGLYECSNKKDEFNCKNDEDIVVCDVNKTLENSSKFNGTSECNNGIDECEITVFSDSKELIKYTFLKVFIYINTFLTLFCNICVIVNYLRKSSKNSVSHKHTVTYFNRLLVTNLAVADCAMGIALMIVAIKSTEYSDKFCEKNADWRASYGCTWVGVLVTVSSQASLNFLLLLTLYRTYTSLNPFNVNKLSLLLCYGLIFVMWFLSIGFAFVPIALNDVFAKDYVIRKTRFFSSRKVSNSVIENYKSKTIEIASSSLINYVKMSKKDLNYFFFETKQSASRFPQRQLEIKNILGYYGATSVCFPDLYAQEAPNKYFSLITLIYNLVVMIVIIVCYFVIYRRSKSSRIAMINQKLTEFQEKKEKALRYICIFTIFVCFALRFYFI